MTKQYEESGTLLDKTIALLDERDILDVLRDTGLPYHWLNNLSKRVSKSPSVNRIQFLYEYLSGKNLEV